MSTDKIDSSNKDATVSSTDDLTKTTKSGDVELTENELANVSGGSIRKSAGGDASGVAYLTFPFPKVP